MKEYNFKNWNNQPSYNAQNTVRKVHLNEPQNSESQSNSEPLAYGISDKLGGWLGIDKTAKKAAEQVISQMGKDLKLEARKAAQDEVKKIEGKMLTLVEEKANKIATEKANQIEKKISNSIDKTVKSVEANAEKAVKKVGPEVADLLKPEIKTQVEEAVKKYTEEKIESLIKPEITSKIDDLVTAQSKEVSTLLEDEMNKLIKDAHKNLNEKIDKIECELTEVKSYVLEVVAQSFSESAKLLSLIAEDEKCENQDLVYF